MPAETLAQTTGSTIRPVMTTGRISRPSQISARIINEATGVMVLPIVWANVSAGIAGRDPLLLEMARVFRLPRLRVLRRITVPSVLPHFRAAMSAALGLGWKAGIAAEVLTVPARSIGKMIYESKLYLETTDLFVWTAAVIALSLVIERLLLRLVRGSGRKGESGHV